MSKICKKCGENIPHDIVIDGIKHCLSKRVLCLSCSPFGQRGYQAKFIDNNNKLCPMCHVVKPITEFYTNHRGILSSYCKVCTSLESKNRIHRFKQQCLAYLGTTKCSICGYDKCIAALDFHHIDLSAKDFSISKLRFYTLNDMVRAELDKCIVLCSNCHRELHFNIG